MENASKALIIVSAMLISIMILSLMMYLFGQAARVPAGYEETKQEEMILEFNSKFEGYGKVADFNDDKKINQYKLVSTLTGSETSEINNPSNTFSEVISACNAAYDINDRNGNDKNNSVVIVIDFGKKIGSPPAQEYCIVPLGNAKGESILKKGYVFAEKPENVTASTTQVNIYSLLDVEIDPGFTVSSVRMFDDATNKVYGMKYKYYFDGILEYGENDTFANFGKITKVKFILKTNTLY